MHGIISILRRASRRLVRSPAFTVPVLLTLSVGIGSAVAVFALVDAVVLRPLPFAEPDGLVTLRHRAPGLGITDAGQSSGTYVLYRAENRAFSDLGAYWEREYSITDGAVPERVPAAIVTPSVFAVLKVPPMLGQWLSLTEGAGTVVISYALWQRRYGGDQSVIGRTIEINRAPSKIVGVMPATFSFPHPETQLWYANRLAKASRAGITVHDMFMTTIARLRPGVSTEAASRDVQRMIPALSTAYPDASPELLRRAQLTAVVVPLKDALVRDVRPMLLVLAAAAGVVLLIVYANAITLVLLRAERQQAEIATELALGATDGDIAGRCLGEAVLLAVAGGAGGLLLTYAAVRSRFGFTAAQVPRLETVGLEGRTIAVLVSLVVLTAAVLGGVALGRALRLRAAGSPLRVITRLTPTRERLRLQRALVAAQLALALALLVTSAVLARSFQRLSRVDVGFDPSGVLTFEAALPSGTYGSYHAQANFFGQVLAQLRTVPGVSAAEAVQNGIPLTPIDEFTKDALAAVPIGASGASAPDSTAASSALASPGYFGAMRIPLVSGRTFAAGDLLNPAHPVVISAALARALFPGSSAINRQIRFTSSKRTELPPSTVVGVVGDVPGTTVSDGPSKRLYLPMLQDLRDTPEADPLIPYWPFEMTIVLRTNLPLVTAAAAVRRAVGSLDAKVPVWRERTVESIVDASTARVRLMTSLFLLATGAALVLGIIGIYGVLSYAVSQRTAELGVRLALGASPAAITRMVVGDGVRIALVGIGVGLVGAALLTRALRVVLYQVSAADPLAFVAMPVVLLGLALVAAYLPAHRAGRTDAATALRSQ